MSAGLESVSPARLLSLEEGLQEIQSRISASVGDADLDYIYTVQRWVFILEVAGRLLIFMFFFPPAYILGVLFLSVSKIIENTELGHNLMHGQYDWADDPLLAGSSYEFDVVATSDNWRSGHNDHHHTNTGIEELDNDIGVLRFSENQAWRWYHLLQLPVAFVFAMLSQWGVAIQDMRIGDLSEGRISVSSFWKYRFSPFLKKSFRKLAKDYVIFPALSGPFFLQVLVCNLVANCLRNVWVWLIIACGHCVGGITLYKKADVVGLPEQHWFVRQITSSANFATGKLMTIMTGHLGYHIEHHLFPTVPARHYPAISEEVRAICREYALPYNDRPLGARIGEVLVRLARFSFP
ncbi:MAG: acyl-CoA desaturase [Alcanivorax sp.]|nr:acyl-CoA desaturase [Alcanivorax sp.]